MKVLLLNLPSPRNLQRDHHCSVTSKTAGNYWPPMDLLLSSGSLAARHDLQVLDALAERCSADETLGKVVDFSPGAIVALSSVLSAEPDLQFLQECKAATGCKIVVLGDIHYFRPEVMLQCDTIDAVCRQYPPAGLSAYLDGEPDCADVAYRKDGTLHVGRYAQGEIEYPPPRHDLFPLHKYRFPLAQRAPFSVLMTTLSCPMECSYCAVSSVPYRQRPLHNVLEELDYLRDMQIVELGFADFMINANVPRAKQLCREMIRRDYRFTWTCLLHPHKFDAELLSLLREAGCHSVMIGVDTAHPALLEANHRKMDLERTRATFEGCRAVGIQTFAFLIIGLPGETRETALASIDFVCSLQCDYLSVNLFVARPGSKYMRDFRSLSEVLSDPTELDSTLTRTSHCELSIEQLLKLRRQALLRFYMRPSVILGHLLKKQDWRRLGLLVSDGARLLASGIA